MATTDWSRLPGEMLVLIAKRLNKKSGGGDGGGPPPTQLDLLRIGAVCKTWRSSLSHHYSSSTSFPLNLPFPMFPNPYLNPDRQAHFSLSHSTLYLLQPPSSSTSLFFLRLQKNQQKNQAIDFDPTNATLLSNRSICWIHMGQAEHALADAKACRALKPYWPKACYREGHALQLLEKFEEAAGAFYEGLMLDPKNKDILHAFREVAEALEKRKVAVAVDNWKLL